MSKFEKFERVYITKGKRGSKYHKVDEAYVVNFDDDGNPIVEYNLAFMIHIEVFKDEELKPYVR